MKSVSFWLALLLSLSLVLCPAALALESEGEPVPISDEGIAIPIADEEETDPIADDILVPAGQTSPTGNTITVTYRDGDTTLYQVAIPRGTAPEVYPIQDADGSPVTAWVLNGEKVADPTAITLTSDSTFTVWTPPALNTSSHIAYVSGRSEGVFDPYGSLTRAEAAAMLYALLQDQSPGDLSCTFSDVLPGSWYTEAVTTLASLGILSGYPDGTFRPEATVTRAEFVTMAAAFYPLEASATCSFPDVPADHWAQQSLIAALSRGWISGYPDGTFRPSQAITRAEAVTLINAALDRGTAGESLAFLLDDTSPFTDVQPNQWFYQAVMEAATDHMNGNCP